MRAASPDVLRVAVASARRSLRDARERPSMAKRGKATDGFDHLVVAVDQPIKGGAFLEGKRANLLLGAERLDGVVLAPGETFSFWKLVGRPSLAAGFAMGRTIRNGVVGGEVGGGLCQLSGLLYEAALRAGLTPVERHPHSRDLYAEADRFAPLGLDATVVWPYKDLRLANRLSVPVCFRLAVGEEGVSVAILAPSPIEGVGLEIARIDLADRRQVRVTRHRIGGAAEVVSDDVYLIDQTAAQ